MRERIENMTYDEERALYHLVKADVVGCTFAGPADGESVLKEGRDITVTDCRFSLRYPLWHDKGFSLCRSHLDELTRAPIWYSEDGEIEGCTVKGVKCLRECDRIRIRDCEIDSEEFGWRCRDVSVKDTFICSPYLFFESRNLTLEGLRMKGKYSFQYVESMEVRNSDFDTKDAFWHSRNVTVYDSVIRGEYLGWYSENLHLVRCHIVGTQPLCYCKGLVLEDCTMEGTDLSFEYSDVEATVIGSIDSVKNPRSGTVIADAVGEIISDSDVIECTGRVVIR